MNWVENTVCSGNFTRGEQRSMNYEEAATKDLDKDDDKDDNDHGDEDDNDHDNDHDENENDDSDNMISSVAAAGIAIGCSLFVLIVMSLVLYFVKESYKGKLKIMANKISVYVKYCKLLSK